MVPADPAFTHPSNATTRAGDRSGPGSVRSYIAIGHPRYRWPRLPITPALRTARDRRRRTDGERVAYIRAVTEIPVTGDPLSPEDVVAVARRRATAVPGPALEARMRPARDVVDRVIGEDRTVYGITTGFGALASTRIEASQAAELQLGLVRSHAAGVGERLPAELVRAMMLLRARTLAQGHSGVRPLIVERILELLRRDLLPVVPSQGSVGASGDLAPFAHLALPLIGEGELWEDGEANPAGDVLSRHGLEPLRLDAKEGLSLLNGTEGMLAMGVLGLASADNLAVTADAACALSVEALLGSARPFDPRIHRLRPHPGQARSARLIAALLHGSEINSSHSDDFDHAVQDAYSLRCAPQVHGAVVDTLTHARGVFERELGAVADNPLVFAADGDVLSGGNFHGQPLAFALDFMAIAVAELGSISERRTDRILDPDRSSGLPPFLASPSRAHLRIHDRPVHGGGVGGGEPGAGSSRLGRLGAHLRAPGGPRVDGLGRRSKARGRARQRLQGAGDRAAVRRRGRRSSGAAAPRRRDCGGARRRAGGGSAADRRPPTGTGDRGIGAGDR